MFPQPRRFKSNTSGVQQTTRGSPQSGIPLAITILPTLRSSRQVSIKDWSIFFFSRSRRMIQTQIGLAGALSCRVCIATKSSDRCAVHTLHCDSDLSCTILLPSLFFWGALLHGYSSERGKLFSDNDTIKNHKILVKFLGVFGLYFIWQS